nr:immunoglobulin heavy chain junction region [Mus musculus]
CARAITYFDYW